MGSRDVTLALDDAAKGSLGIGDVTLAYDDATKGTLGSRDVQCNTSL